LSRVSVLSLEGFSLCFLRANAQQPAQAIHCARLGHDTVVWARGSDTVDAINWLHENTVYLPGCPCPPSLRASSDLVEVVTRSELLLMVVPTQYIVTTLGRWVRVLYVARYVGGRQVHMGKPAIAA
jgi:glycerol-3-phosphate dehydrogenase